MKSGLWAKAKSSSGSRLAGVPVQRSPRKVFTGWPGGSAKKMKRAK